MGGLASAVRDCIYRPVARRHRRVGYHDARFEIGSSDTDDDPERDEGDAEPVTALETQYRQQAAAMRSLSTSQTKMVESHAIIGLPGVKVR